jgi:hypothetical protein
MTEHHETAKQFVDGLSLVTVIGTLMEMLPSVSALLSIVWVGIRIYETKTVQKMLGRKGGKDASDE